MKKVLLSLVMLVALFLAYVSTRPGTFHYERSGVINAPADKIFPYISNFKMGKEWTPYAQRDPNMKETFSGPEGQAGSVEEFEGNGDVGSGKLEILSTVPNEAVDIRLTMTKPFRAENTIQYRLTPEGTGTRFTWSMSGDGGYLTKLISVFIDCEKMITKDFDVGIANLRKIMETPK